MINLDTYRNTAGREFAISAQEEVYRQDDTAWGFVYQIVDENNSVFKLLLVVMKSFYPQEEDAKRLVAGDGLTKVRSLLDSERNGELMYPYPDFCRGWVVNPLHE